MSYGINNLSSRSRPSARTPKDGDDAAAVAGTTDTTVDLDVDGETRGKGEVEVEVGKVGSSLIAFLDKDDDDDSNSTDESIMLEESNEEGRTEEGLRAWVAAFCSFHWTEISDRSSCVCCCWDCCCWWRKSDHEGITPGETAAAASVEGKEE